MEIRLYNTVTRKKETVKPLRDDNTIRIYICGPTVYDHSHLGHFRTFIFYDVLVRYLKHLGFNVIHVVNITDIDDKIINRALEEGVSYREIAERYIDSFLEDWKSLNLLPPYVMPRATYHIKDMIRIIEKLIEKGYAYHVGGDVYFDISRFPSYGEISHQKIEELIEGYRVDSSKKKNPLDFALWKEKKDDEPAWESPWGLGRPGWHIECTAMSILYLDPPFEIHGGGEDLKFPHHENERAQSNSYIGREVVKIWTHVGLFKLGREKMSKSLHNIVTIKEVLKNYNPDVVRLFYLSTHYRKQQVYSEEKMIEARNIYEKIVRTYNHLREISEFGKSESIDVSSYVNEFYNAMNDDLNTPRALGIFVSFVSKVESYIKQQRIYDEETIRRSIEFFEIFKKIFGLTLEYTSGDFEDELIKLLIDVRRKLRERKIYDLSDEIREKLRELGVVLEDSGKETHYYRL